MTKIIKKQDCPQFLSGIYKLNFPNGKCYIGLSNNIKRRLKEHCGDSKKGKLPIHQAIKKYGLTEFELLEEISSEDRVKLQERERYWIQYYKSNQKKFGYNITSGGDGAEQGTKNISAGLTQEQLIEVYDLLENHLDLYIYEIAEKFNISSEAISNINRGIHYHNPDKHYPLREATLFKKGHKVKSGEENHLAKFSSKEQIQKVKNAIINSDLSLEELGEKFGVSYATISNINRGLTYFKEDESYPLRKKKTCKKNKINEQLLLEIYQALQDNQLSIHAIAQKFQIHESTVRRINNGATHHKEDLKYPIRKKINQ